MTAHQPFLSPAAWATSFEGHDIVDCAIRDRDFVYVVLRKVLPQEQASMVRDHDIPTRLAGLFLRRPATENRCVHQGVEGFAQPRCGASRLPIAQGLVASIRGDVLAMGSGKRDMETVLGNGRVTALRKIRSIEGRAYAVGLHREVYRRDNVGEWTLLSDGIQPVPKGDTGFEFGFWDIDGFSEQDLYAVGGAGDVWHHDGEEWSPCEFGSTESLFTVCCGGDGAVYISAEGGSLYRGRGNRWQKVWSAEHTVPYRDLRWFDDTLWLCSDYHLHQWDGETVHDALHNGERLFLRGHMDAADGVLVVASLDQVHLFDSTAWRALVQP